MDDGRLGPLVEGAGTVQAVTGGVSYARCGTPSVFCSAKATSLRERGKGASYRYSGDYAISPMEITKNLPFLHFIHFTRAFSYCIIMPYEDFAPHVNQ